MSNLPIPPTSGFLPKVFRFICSDIPTLNLIVNFVIQSILQLNQINPVLQKGLIYGFPKFKSTCFFEFNQFLESSLGLCLILFSKLLTIIKFKNIQIFVFKDLNFLLPIFSFPKYIHLVFLKSFHYFKVLPLNPSFDLVVFLFHISYQLSFFQ